MGSTQTGFAMPLIETLHDRHEVPLDTSATIADTFRQKFGDDALAVARRQYAAADDNAAIWEEIVSRLEG